ncbi:UNVERIFIED_CONTAM: hypothetical protein HDU68_004077 [Siphonaria sp. JEL0065]|nr:hypothetical protein HDU68_004077 [Siphonaria sp. JEL0065]
MERLLDHLADIEPDGTLIEEDNNTQEPIQLDLKRIFKTKATTVSKKDEKDQDQIVRDQNWVNTALKDRIYYAREEIGCAIDILTKLEGARPQPLQLVPGQLQTQQTPVIKITAAAKPPAPTIPKQIDQLKATLSAKKTHLSQIAMSFDKASSRLASTLTNETKFYGKVAIDELRQHNWILHSKEERSGRGIYVDYGLTKAGSTSTEICEAYFTWSSTSSAGNTKSKTKNKITLKFGHGKTRLVEVGSSGGQSTNLSSQYILSNSSTTPSSYTKIQGALDSAKTAAFETELFRELSASATHSKIPGSIHITPTSITIKPTPASLPLQINFLSPTPTPIPIATGYAIKSYSQAPPSLSDASSAFILLNLKLNLRKSHRANQARFLRVYGFKEWEETYHQRSMKLFRSEGKNMESKPVLDDHPSRILEPVVRDHEWRQVMRRVDKVLEGVQERFGGRRVGGWILNVDVQRKVLPKDGKVLWSLDVIGSPIIKIELIKTGAMRLERLAGATQSQKVELKDLCIMQEFVERELEELVSKL